MYILCFRQIQYVFTQLLLNFFYTLSFLYLFFLTGESFDITQSPSGKNSLYFLTGCIFQLNELINETPSK